MQLKNATAKASLLTRLRKIEGQVRGVQNMIQDERDCREIMQQLVAVRAAVQSASVSFLEEFATDCLLNPENDDTATRKELVDNLLALVNKAQ
jgi:DNA-binding FrmR family transcriptional regulator